MKILFTSMFQDSISTQINILNYSQLNKLGDVQIDFFNERYSDYDIVLFMGYDPRIEEARKLNPKAIIGVIDVRPPMLHKALGADFIIANGIEMQDWLADYFDHIFIYPIYTPINIPLKKHEQHKPLIIGYHGNKIHLMTMFPKITEALERLAVEHPIEFWAIYNVGSLGVPEIKLWDYEKIPLRIFQWTKDVYQNVLAKVDIGIIPNLIPINESVRKYYLSNVNNPFNGEHESDVFLSYKATSNPGRIFMFSQLGIPVVADMYPSAGQVIQDGYSGYLAKSTGGWYHSLKKLAESSDLRSQMGRQLYENFLQTTNSELLNKRLIEFIKNLM